MIRKTVFVMWNKILKKLLLNCGKLLAYSIYWKIWYRWYGIRKTPTRKIPTHQTPPAKFPPGIFPPRKFPPGLFPPTFLNIPTRVLKFFVFFHHCHRRHWYYLKDCFVTLCFKSADARNSEVDVTKKL